MPAVSVELFFLSNPYLSHLHNYLNVFVFLCLLEPPNNVRITDITKNTITLAWQQPSDGGSKITGYFIEKRDDPKGRWTKAHLTNITNKHYTVTGLTQDESYEFRVMAKNAVGSVSNPSIVAGPVTCVDTFGRLYCIVLHCIAFCC